MGSVLLRLEIFHLVHVWGLGQENSLREALNGNRFTEDLYDKVLVVMTMGGNDINDTQNAVSR